MIVCHGKRIVSSLVALILALSATGCMQLAPTSSAQANGMVPDAPPHPQSSQHCAGKTTVQKGFEDFLEATSDDALLQKALGQPNKRGLCQGQVYTVKKNTNVAVFRAWNSTNPKSQMGNWWVFEIPEGKIAQYRADYEICFQWTPLDKLVRCTLKPDAHIVLGTGQSVECSPYVTYPASEKLQIYIDNVPTALSDCVHL